MEWVECTLLVTCLICILVRLFRTRLPPLTCELLKLLQEFKKQETKAAYVFVIHVLESNSFLISVTSTSNIILRLIWTTVYMRSRSETYFNCISLKAQHKLSGRFAFQSPYSHLFSNNFVQQRKNSPEYVVSSCTLAFHQFRDIVTQISLTCFWITRYPYTAINFSFTCILPLNSPQSENH